MWKKSGDLVERLKRFGAEHGYLESELARKLKVSKELLGAWFSGEAPPSLDAGLRIRWLVSRKAKTAKDSGQRVRVNGKPESK